MKIRTTIAVMAAKITGHVCKLMARTGQKTGPTVIPRASSS